MPKFKELSDAYIRHVSAGIRRSPGEKRVRRALLPLGSVMLIIVLSACRAGTGESAINTGASETEVQAVTTGDESVPESASPESTAPDGTAELTEQPGSTTEDTSTEGITVGGNIEMPVRIEAEDGKLIGARIHQSRQGYSGDGYVGNFENEGDSVEVSFILDKAGVYQLNLGYYLPLESGNKINTILLNGDYYASHEFDAKDEFAEAEIGPVLLNEGRNTLTFIKNENDWGWMYVDYFDLDIAPDNEISYEAEADLINPNSTGETVRLYDYLRSLYGNKVISGQQLYFTEEEEISRILELTGKKPAMKGYDFINQTEGGAIDDQVTRAIRWVEEENGILTMCWHWWAPSGGRAFYTADTDFDVREAVKAGTDEYDLILRDIDGIATLLLDMQERGIAVIWRPLHEAAGGWFWWGAHGPEPYKALWDILYDRLVNFHGVNNLIWVANAQHPDWYVGDEKADIIGEDIYPGERVYSAYLPKFMEAYETVGGQKIVALTENGPLPSIDEMKASGAMWAWFMPWWGEFTTTDHYTEDDVYRAVYAHEDVITLEDLPDDLYR